MLLVSLHGLIIPIVTVASYSPTNAPQTLHSVNPLSDQKLINSVRSGLSSGLGERIEDEIGVGIRAGSGDVRIGSQLGSKHFPISPSTCIACDPLGEYGSDEGWMRSGEEEAEHRCPEWASAPPSLDDAADGNQTKIRIRCQHLDQSLSPL